MKECSTPPSEAVLWEVTWLYFYETGLSMETARVRKTSQTAWGAWQQCPGAPNFGNCRVTMLEDNPAKNG